MKSIIAAVDFSDATPAVVETAVNIAKCIGANLGLFHAIEQQPTFVTCDVSMTGFSALGDLQEEARLRATRLLGDLHAMVREELPHATAHLAEGNPLHELLGHVKQTGAHFVVVGSHGHGALGSLILGSVAEGMIRKSTVPTLVVPAGPTTPPSKSSKAPHHEPSPLHQMVR